MNDARRMPLESTTLNAPPALHTSGPIPVLSVRNPRPSSLPKPFLGILGIWAFEFPYSFFSLRVAFRICAPGRVARWQP